LSLKKAQESVKNISYEIHKTQVFTSSFFIALMAEQLGQVAHKYMHEERHAKDIEVDITNIVLASLAYLNWLEKDATNAFKKSLEKHQKAIERMKKQKKEGRQGIFS
jgi:NTP pyrophosphatase (non-canonical NTP hydrolase)